MVKRILFDLDGTLIKWDDEWNNCVKKTYEYFDIPYNDGEFEKFNKTMIDYEIYHRRFDKKEMSRYFRRKLNLNIPDEFVEVWTSYLSELVPDRDTKLIYLLEYLSSKYSLVILSNWFYNQQESKLKLFGIYKYFDELITCDKYDKKPCMEMFEVACKNYKKDEVVMVGDSFKTDIKGALNYGIYSYYLTSVCRRNNKKYKIISNIYELSEYL